MREQRSSRSCKYQRCALRPRWGYLSFLSSARPASDLSADLASLRVSADLPHRGERPDNHPARRRVDPSSSTLRGTVRVKPPLVNPRGPELLQPILFFGGPK